MDSVPATSSYTHTEKSVQQDLSLKEISQVFLNNWVLFVLMFFVMSVAGTLLYVYKIPYIGQASITVNDAQNSSLQSFATEFFGLSKTVSDGKKSNSPLMKHAEYLKTTEFFETLLAEINNAPKNKNLTLPEIEGYKQFNDLTTPENAVSTLDQLSKIKLDSDFELKVSFAAPTKEMALFLTHAAVQTTLTELKKREMSDITKVENFIKQQQVAAEKNMTSLNTELAQFQNKPENLISLSSKEKVGEYLSELMVRKNEIKMKIAENKKIIEDLSANQTKTRESQLYGNQGRIQYLKLQNNMHENNLAQIQASVDRVTSMAKAIPVASQKFDELKKKSEIEFEKYKSLTEALAKAEAQQLSIESRFEVLEMARMDKVKPLVSLSVLLLIAFVLSQIISSVIIYIGWIWNSNTVMAQSSRNVVIIDSHSLDPRIIIEDSKIRFRIKSASFDESANENLDSNEQTNDQRLTFRLFNKKSANGEDNEI